jgi:PAS domain S-box-containing protein
MGATTRRASKLQVARREPTDEPIQIPPQELETIRAQFQAIERVLGALFGNVYSREAASLEARAGVADLLDDHFDEIVKEWAKAVRHLFKDASNLQPAREFLASLSNALLRFIAHLRDPDDLRTYIHLRKHCQEGILSRAKPSQFDTIHIALKQVAINHVRAELSGKRLEIIRDALVAAIDERRLMVSQFYIESRERALRVSEEKYRNSINHAPDPMYEIDPDTLFVIGANSAAENLHRAMTADAGETIVGRHAPDLVPPSKRSEVIAHLTTVVENGSNQAFDLEVGNRYFDVNSALIPFGERKFIQLILHDVTQRRQMLGELLNAERLAAVGTFAAGVAHEVNNPLASISSLVQSLLPAETDATRRASLRTMLSQITRISTTLKELMNFARPSAAHPQMVEVNALVRETLRLVSYNDRFRGLGLATELDAGLRPVYADRNGIQQVLLNLLFNAADASSPPNGVIRVITSNEARGRNGDRSEKISIRIVDNGVGIRPEHLERVFDPFFTTKPPGAGTGLGLSLCQRIILANRGSIRVESTVGRGTTVKICLPAAPDAEEAKAAALA